MTPPNPPQLRRVLKLRDLVFYGIILIQPTAPLPIFGVIADKAQGHVPVAILIAMVAMLFTAMSYGQMARAYPVAGSAYSYVGRELHPTLGQITGWMMTLDYVMNPIICVIFCGVAARNILPGVPFVVWACGFAGLFTWLNCRGIKASARFNLILAAALGVVLVFFFAAAFRHLGGAESPPIAWLQPFYDPRTFDFSIVMGGASIAALTYIGFDGISTLSEEVENPRRNIMLATVLTCFVTGVLATVEVYVGQLVWPDFSTFPNVETAFSSVAGRAGGPLMFHLINIALLVACVGSGTGAQLGAARLLYAMGRDGVLPRRPFAAIDPVRHLPRNNVLIVGAVALAGAFVVDFGLGCELLNFGAFFAFMGVNIAAFSNGYLRADRRVWWRLVCPLLGFSICLWLWLNLGAMAKLVGMVWVAVGLVLFFSRRRQIVVTNPSVEETN